KVVSDWMSLVMSSMGRSSGSTLLDAMRILHPADVATQFTLQLATESTGYIRPDRERTIASCHRARLLVPSPSGRATESERTRHPHWGIRRKALYRRGWRSAPDRVQEGERPVRTPCSASTPCHSAGAAPNRSALPWAWRYLRPRTPARPGKMQ